jgi:hypothetical protein
MSDPRSQPQSACPFCGGETFEWGHVMADSAHFVREDDSFWKQMKRSFHGKLLARKCTTCKNVQLYDPD